MQFLQLLISGVAQGCIYGLIALAILSASAHADEGMWMPQQLPWAMLFYLIGGWSWLVWGTCVRVSVCVTGHWLVGHFARVERLGGVVFFHLARFEQQHLQAAL